MKDVPRIIEETVIAGRVIDELRIADSCLNNPDCTHIRKLRGESMEPCRRLPQEDTSAPKTQ